MVGEIERYPDNFSQNVVSAKFYVEGKSQYLKGAVVTEIATMHSDNKY